MSKTWNAPWLNSPLNFTVSSNQNKFVVVGCDTYGDLYGYQQNGEYISTGCASECESTKYIVNSSCSGVGCCEVDIPNGLRNISIKLNSINNYTKVESFNPCGHAFISKQGTFTFSIDSLRTLREIEVICQWFLIGRSVLRHVMMLPTNRVTDVEVIARVLIPNGTHTSAMVVKVIIHVSMLISR